MKILTLFFALSAALDEMMLMMMLQNQQGVMNPYQANQMNHILPLLLIDSSRGSSENSELMIMLMMQGLGHDVNNALPFLLLGDSTGDGFDFTTFFLFSSMTQRDCSVSTPNQFNALLPMMLMDKDEDRSDLMLMMMMQVSENGLFYHQDENSIRFLANGRTRSCSYAASYALSYTVWQ